MTSLHFKRYGQGKPLIILHGLFGTADNWHNIATQLAETMMVYCLDLRNHGRSPHTPDFGYPEMAADVLQFMESEGMWQANIAGHSMGGKVAMHLALQHPEVVEKLTVIDIAPKKYEGGHESILDALLSFPLEKINSRKEAEEILLAKIPELGVRQFLLKNLTREPDGTYHWKMNLPVISANYAKLMESVQGDAFEGDTLFVRGAASDYILDSDVADIKRLFPKMQLISIAHAGHWVHADNPADLLATLKKFLG